MKFIHFYVHNDKRTVFNPAVDIRYKGGAENRIYLRQKTVNISQGNVATPLRRFGILNSDFV